MKLIKTIIYSLAFLFALSLTTELSAQVTIGATLDPNKGALLDLKEKNPVNPASDNSTSNKGLGMPRVKLTTLSALTDIQDATGKERELTGLFVYNVHTDSNLGIQPGLYVWDGTLWRRLVTSPQIN